MLLHGAASRTGTRAEIIICAVMRLKRFSVGLRKLLPALDTDSLNLIERDLVVGAIVELGGAGTLVRGHRLGVLERATVVEVGR